MARISLPTLRRVTLRSHRTLTTLTFADGRRLSCLRSEWREVGIAEDSRGSSSASGRERGSIGTSGASWHRLCRHSSWRSDPNPERGDWSSSSDKWQGLPIHGRSRRERAP
jgi:hypothetical protein